MLIHDVSNRTPSDKDFREKLVFQISDIEAKIKRRIYEIVLEWNERLVGPTDAAKKQPKNDLAIFCWFFLCTVECVFLML